MHFQLQTGCVIKNLCEINYAFAFQCDSSPIFINFLHVFKLKTFLVFVAHGKASKQAEIHIKAYILVFGENL